MVRIRIHGRDWALLEVSPETMADMFEKTGPVTGLPVYICGERLCPLPDAPYELIPDTDPHPRGQNSR